MADCQFGDRTKWKISRSGIQKRTVLEMGAITGNGNAISSTCKLRVWVLTNNTPRGHYVVSTIGQKGCFVPEDVKKCIQWDSNPRQLRIQPERTALDHSAMNAREEKLKFVHVLFRRY